MDLFLGRLLRTGVMLSGSIVLVGAVLLLWSSGTENRDYHHFRGEPAELRYVPAVLRHAVLFEGAAVIQLGVLVLISTPIARVAFALCAFARQRDLRFVTITLIVLSVLIFSLAGPHT